MIFRLYAESTQLADRKVNLNEAAEPLDQVLFDVNVTVSENNKQVDYSFWVN